MAKGTPIDWPSGAQEWCRENRPIYPGAVLVELFNRHFSMSVSKDSLRSYCKRHRIMTGRKGSEVAVIWNTGTKGLTHRNKTSYKKGAKPASSLPVGSVGLRGGKTDDEGKVIEHPQWWVKLEEPKLWKPLYRVAWECYRGPIPRAHVLVSLDLDPDNCCDPDNYQCLSRAELVALNNRSMPRYREATIEERVALITLARLRAKIGSATRKQIA